MRTPATHGLDPDGVFLALEIVGLTSASATSALLRSLPKGVACLISSARRRKEVSFRDFKFDGVSAARLGAKTRHAAQ